MNNSPKKLEIKQVLEVVKSEKELLIEKIIELRQKTSLPTDDHTLQFMKEAKDHEILEIYRGLKELAHIF